MAARQHGLATTAQLISLGLSRAAISNRVSAGRLFPKYRGVYAVGHANLSEYGEWMAAVLAASPGAALSHVAAGSLHAIWRRRVRGIDVVVSGRRRAQAGFKAHWCRHLDSRDLARRRGIPVTTVPRTLVDLADVLTAAQLANVIHEAAFRGLFDADRTRAAMERARGRHNLDVLARAIAAHEAGSAGTRSGAEDAFLAAVTRAGAPEPRVNTPIAVSCAGAPEARVNTRVESIEVDFHWPELGLCVEVDGPGHARPRTRRDDEARDRLLHANGLEVIRLDADAAPDELIARLRAAAHRGA